MPEMPQGTVTFAFTDVEGSTALLKRLGDGYADVIGAHRRLVRDTFTARDGVEIDTQGDAFFFAFVRARDAVAAAAEVQRAHAAHSWPEGAEVLMRVGLHTGEPTLGEEGYLGLDVVRAARLCGVCRGGQVLLSETTRALVGSTLPPGVALFPIGERHLKDIDEPERVYELEIEGVEQGLEAEELPPAAAGRKRGSSRREEEWEEELEQRVEDFVKRTTQRALQWTSGKLGRLASGGGPDRPDSGGVNEMAARADELGKMIEQQIRRAMDGLNEE